MYCETYSSLRWHALCPWISIFIIIWGNTSLAPIARNGGFYCNDTTIKKPYSGDSICASYLFLSLLGGAAIIIYVTENFRGKDSKDFKRYLKYFYAGFLYVLAATEVLKLKFGELRPHFYSTCQPDVDKIKCSNGLVTDFNCTGVAPDWLINRDIYKSFPSGHASLSFYTFVFLCVYVRRRLLSVSGNWFLGAWQKLVPVLSLSWAVVCCASRLLDHRHFWWDVLVGVAIGLLGGLLVVYLSLKEKILPQQKVS